MNNPIGLRVLAVAAAVALGALAFAGCDSTPASAPTPSVSEESDSAPGFDDSAEDELVAVPAVVDMDGEEANSEVESNDLTATYVASSEDEDINEPRNDATGCSVVDQDPAADEEVDPGSEVKLSLDCRQVDWKNQEGDEWDGYADAYEQATDEGCAALFGETRDGSLYLDDTEYTRLDCVTSFPAEAADDPPSDVPDDFESEGARAGFDAGCEALFDLVGVTELYWGRTYYTVDNCLALNSY